MSPERVSRLLAALSAAYRVNVSAETISIYVAALVDEDDDAVDAAGGECIKREEFFPTVAVLMRHMAPAGARPEFCAECGSKAVAGRVGTTPYCLEHFRKACDDSRSAMAALDPRRRALMREGQE